MSIFNVLQLDGGGIRGIIFLQFLAYLENKLDKKIYDLFDMFIGTSTGGISAAMFAAGYSAQDILKLYIEDGNKIFSKRPFGYFNPKTWIRGSVYDRKYIDSLCDNYLKIKMKDLKKIFICTSINMEDDQYTHFFKSYKPNYAEYKVADLVKRTYSAPTYFGYLKDKEGLWCDGGVGVHNCTLLEAYIETVRLKKKDYYILSCGTGYVPLRYDGKTIIQQVKDFIPIARTQAMLMQINNSTELSINFDRVDIELSKEHDELDAVEYTLDFIKYGNKVIGMYLDIISKKFRE